MAIPEQPSQNDQLPSQGTLEEGALREGAHLLKIGEVLSVIGLADLSNLQIQPSENQGGISDSNEIARLGPDFAFLMIQAGHSLRTNQE